MAVIQLLAAGFLMNLVVLIFILTCVSLIFIILLQKGRGGGLAGAFGGGSGSGLLGTKTGDFMTWVTVALVAVFLILAVVLDKWYKPSVSELEQAQQSQAVEQPAEPQPIEQAAPQAEPAQEQAASTTENQADEAQQAEPQTEQTQPETETN